MGCHNVSVSVQWEAAAPKCVPVFVLLWCVRMHCVSSNGIITQSYCVCSGLIWQLDRAVVTYFCSVFITSYPVNFQQSDWRQQDSNGRVIWASGTVAFACWCCLLIGHPWKKSQRKHHISLSNMINDQQQSSWEVTVIFKTGCGLCGTVRETIHEHNHADYPAV